MDRQERDEVVKALQEEFQEYFSWLVSELGSNYFISNMNRASNSMEKDAESFIERRSKSERKQRWERDRYAFYRHPSHPSVYGLLEVEDLQILHYQEEIVCEHDKIQDTLSETELVLSQDAKRYEQDFGVLLASQKLGWMYRLDFCEMCGLVEVWSMEYNPDEIVLFDSSC